MSDVELPEVPLTLFGSAQLPGEIKHWVWIPLLPQAAPSGKEFYIILLNNPFLRQPGSFLPLDQQICKYLNVFESVLSLSFLLPKHYFYQVLLPHVWVFYRVRIYYNSGLNLA